MQRMRDFLFVKLEEERKRLISVGSDCDRMRERLMHEADRTKDITVRRSLSHIILSRF